MEEVKNQEAKMEERRRNRWARHNKSVTIDKGTNNMFNNTGFSYDAHVNDDAGVRLNDQSRSSDLDILY